MGLFLTDQKIQLVFDRHDNKEKEIGTEIPQDFLVSPFLFLIYISRIFNKMSKTNLLVTLIWFIDDFGFIASSSWVKKKVKAFERVLIEVIALQMLNTVTYKTLKIKAMLFSRSHQQRLNKQL